MIKRTPQPPYSPDMAPLYFYLFRYIKDWLKGHRFTSLEELKGKKFEICKSIRRDTLKRVFQDWIKRSDQVALQKGEYYSKY